MTGTLKRTSGIFWGYNFTTGHRKMVCSIEDKGKKRYLFISDSGNYSWHPEGDDFLGKNYLIEDTPVNDTDKSMFIASLNKLKGIKLK